jgi:protein-L-isoaspartate(D-aspartate) O-methyltransferase
VKELAEDTLRDKGLRRKLIQELESKGIRDKKVLEAMMAIPRHLFVDTAFRELAYTDQALRIAYDQTISQPYTVAFMTEQLQVKKHEKVLEVGTGSGYQAAVLALLGARVYTIERIRGLYLSAQKILEKLGLHVRSYYGDGYKGLPAYAPFDKIIVTAGASEVPQALVEQLRNGGRMVIPVGEGDLQEMMLVTKDAEGRVEHKKLGSFRFVPMLENKA